MYTVQKKICLEEERYSNGARCSSARQSTCASFILAHASADFVQSGRTALMLQYPVQYPSTPRQP